MGTPETPEGSGAIAALPYVDEHAVAVAAGVEETWAALLEVAERSFSGGATPRVARALGCEDVTSAGPRPLALGSAIPGFHVAVARTPPDGPDAPSADGTAELALAGRHRFSNYALTFRVDPAPGGARLRAETRAEFPGLKGEAYKTLVIRSRGHVLVTRRILTAVKRRAERSAAAEDRRMSELLEITPTESVEILRSEPGLLEVRGIYAAGAGKPPPKHLHPTQAEEIEVTAGTLRAVVGGEEMTLAAGDTVEVPAGTVHTMWNESEQAAETIWRTRPAGRTEQWFRAIDAVRREGKVGKDGMPGPLAFGVYLTEYRDVFRLAGPDWLLRPALAAIGLVGRARGYRA